MVIVNNCAAPSESTLGYWFAIANWITGFTFLFFIICIFISYAIVEYFKLYQKIAVHLATIVFAAVFKLAYVLRCFSLYNLGGKAF